MSHTMIHKFPVTLSRAQCLGYRTGGCTRCTASEGPRYTLRGILAPPHSSDSRSWAPGWGCPRPRSPAFWVGFNRVLSSEDISKMKLTVIERSMRVLHIQISKLEELLLGGEILLTIFWKFPLLALKQNNFGALRKHFTNPLSQVAARPSISTRISTGNN